MKTRRYRNYYARRRAPHSLSSFYLRAKLIPLAPKLLSALAVGAASAMGFLPTDIRSRLRMQSDRLGEEVSEQSQSIFFREPGLDVLFVRVLASIAGTAGAIVHAAAAFDAIVGWDRSGKLQRLAQVTPRNGYEALMAGMLIAGTSLGQMTGGAAHADKYFDSEMGSNIIEYPGHPKSSAHRLWAPRSLQDMAADIDDLYWAGTYGQSIKITRVGKDEQRRWLVSIPGTNHFDTPSTPNPADTETNIREALGLSSSMRMGIIRALHQAMSEDGVDPSDYASEPIIIVAHSQGGLIAVNLGSLPPEDVGVNVQGILGLGSPGHRACLRSDVVMVDVAHDQDVVPSTDGAGARIRDHRVMVGRNLNQPRMQPLYYAHSSSTYTETVGRLERRSEVTRWDRVGQAIRALQEMLPHDGEPTRVRIYDIWQELDDPHGSVWARVNVLESTQSQDTATDGDNNSHGGELMAQNRSIARILGIVQQRAEQISLPRVSNRLGLAALGVASLGVGAALTRLRPTDRGGRSERFQALIEDTLEQSAQPWVCTSCQVQVNEGFGKPTMVSFSINMEAKQPIDDDRVEFARKLLEAAVRSVWKNPEIAPIGIQGRMSVNGEDTVNMQDLGYSALQVRPEELFERLGAPAIDRGWTPA